MQLTKTHKIIISIIILVLLLGFYMVFDKKSRDDSKKYKDTDSGLATTSDSGMGLKTDGKGYTIEQIPVSDTVAIPKPIPDLNRPLCPVNNTTNEMRCSTLTSEVQKIVEKKVSDIREKLAKDPTFYGGWIDLGMYQKMTGDYEGTILSWTYASKLAPKDYISLGNLGNLYAYYLKDNAMGENYYKQAIAKGPTQSYLYIQLAEVYRDIFKDKAKALAIIDEGLAKIPKDPALTEFKANLVK